MTTITKLNVSSQTYMNHSSPHMNHCPMLAERFRQLNPPGELDEGAAFPACG